MAYTKEAIMARVADYPDIVDVELVKVIERTTVTYKCGHKDTVVLNNLLSKGNKSICKICFPSRNSKKTHKQFLEGVRTPSIEFLEEYKDARSYITFRYVTCGHEHKARPDAFRTNYLDICRVCNPINQKSVNSFLKEVALLSPNIQFTEEYISSDIPISFKYISCGHTTKVIPNNLLVRGDNLTCKICFPFKNTKKTNGHFLEQAALLTSDIEFLEEYNGAHRALRFKYKSCKHERRATPSHLLSQGAGLTCRVCNPIRTSKGERTIADLLSKYTEVETGNRSILEGFEIDIYLPEFKIGIEYNGEYWHSEDKKGKNYHLDKTKLAEKQGIRLIHIFEHEWLQKQNIVKSRLLGMLQQNYKLGARKCQVKELPFADVRDFLDDNHLQGCGSPSKHNLGLYYKDILVAVMTFSKPRFNSNYDYELIRYASLTGINVQGGASKLLKYFTSKYKGSIISYSDKRWSRGNLYKTLGFEYSHSSEPSYFYAKNSTIFSRYQCQKHKLKALVPDFYEDKLTETEIMANAGFNKVFDCGNDVWNKKASTVFNC